MTAPVVLPPGENFLDLNEEFSGAQAAGVVVLPVPYEKTSTYGRGSAKGPLAILDASCQVELFDAALGFEPYRAANGIATLRPLATGGCSGPSLAERLFSEVTPWLTAGKFVVTLGGEHTSVVGAVRAHCHAYEDVTVLQLDAHSDLRPVYQEDAWNHACTMARILDFHTNIVQVGVRSQSKEERRLSEDLDLAVFYGHHIQEQEEERNDWVGRVVDATSARVYVTLDCDVMAPSLVPATGTPEPGGLTWRQMDRLLARLCAERQVVGFDVSELAPIEGMNQSEYVVAKLISRFLGYRFATACRQSSRP